MKKNLKQKIFDWGLEKISQTCKQYYSLLAYSEKEKRYLDNDHKCEGCPFEYEKEEGHGCYVTKFIREHTTVPAYWFNKR